MKLPLLQLIPLVLCLAAPLMAEVTSVSEFTDVEPSASYYEDLRSLVERWGLIGDADVKIAQADSGRRAIAGPQWAAAAKLSRRQLAVSLQRVIQQAQQLVIAAEQSGSDALEEELRVKKIEGAAANKIKDAFAEANAKRFGSLLDFRWPGHRAVKPEAVKGLEAAAPEYAAMVFLLEAAETGSALLNEDGSFTPAMSVPEKRLVEILSRLLQVQPQASGKALGRMEFNLEATSVTRGRFCEILNTFLTYFEERLSNASAAAEKDAKAAVARGAAPAPAPQLAPAATGKKMNLQQTLKAINAVQVKFKASSPEIAPESQFVVRNIAALMATLPATTVMEISVHTDSNGSEPANVKLTQGRADNLRAALIQRGIPAKMLTAKGYGSAKPVADNSTDAGRRKNRRVEYNIRAM